MKITPLDIQQQQFRVRFRGFDMVEVDNFLDLVASEFEELLRENSRLKEDDRQKADRIQELEGAERDLRNALVSAQQICEEMKNQARREGELILEEAKGNARKMLQAAQAEALEIETEIARLKRQRSEFEATLRGTLEVYRKLLEDRPGAPPSSLPENAE